MGQTWLVSGPGVALWLCVIFIPVLVAPLATDHEPSDSEAEVSGSCICMFRRTWRIRGLCKYFASGITITLNAGFPLTTLRIPTWQSSLTVESRVSTVMVWVSIPHMGSSLKE